MLQWRVEKLSPGRIVQPHWVRLGLRRVEPRLSFRFIPPTPAAGVLTEPPKQIPIELPICLVHPDGSRFNNGRASAGNDYWTRSRAVCLLEATTIRMETKDFRTENYSVLATVGILYKARRELVKWIEMPSPTYLQVWKTPLIADCGVAPAPGNGIPAMASRAVSSRQDRPENQLLFP